MADCPQQMWTLGTPHKVYRRCSALQGRCVSCCKAVLTGRVSLLSWLKLWIYRRQFWKGSGCKTLGAQLWCTVHTCTHHISPVSIIHLFTCLSCGIPSLTEGCWKDTQFLSSYLPAGKSTHKHRTKHGRPSVPTRTPRGMLSNQRQALCQESIQLQSHISRRICKPSFPSFSHHITHRTASGHM